jgi:hypothetical protein
MSANNFILINRKSLEVSLRDVDTNALLVKIGKAKTLEEAIDLAQEYQKREIVEYGIHFTGKSK